MRTQFEIEFIKRLDELLVEINKSGLKLHEEELRSILPKKRWQFNIIFFDIVSAQQKLTKDHKLFAEFISSWMERLPGFEWELNELIAKINTFDFTACLDDLKNIIPKNTSHIDFLLLINQCQNIKNIENKNLFADFIFKLALKQRKNFFSTIEYAPGELDLICNFLLEFQEAIKLGDGRNLLMQAILSKNSELVEALIYNAKDKKELLKATDSTGKSIYDYAEASGAKEIITLFKMLPDIDLALQEIKNRAAKRAEIKQQQQNETEKHHRSLNFSKRQKNASFEAPDSFEIEIAKKYLAYVSGNPSFAKKLEAHEPFKISREKLNAFRVGPTVKDKSGKEIQHSFLVLPSDNEVNIVAMERGTKEGVIGTGGFGKVVGLSLIDGEEYCVKVLPSMHAKKEAETLLHLSNKSGRKAWVFERSNEEREFLHKDTQNHTWVGGGEIYDKMYIVQKYIAGVTLRELLSEQSELLWNRNYNLQIALAVATALQTLHDANVTHGDLNPDNIMICYDHKAKKFVAEFIDFGLSEIFNGKSPSEINRFEDDKKVEVEKICAIFKGSLELDETNYGKENDPLSTIIKNLQDKLDVEKKYVTADELYNFRELRQILAEYNVKTSAESSSAMAERIIAILQQNELESKEDSLLFNLKFLTSLPSGLYLKCCVILKQANPQIEDIIRKWSNQQQVASIFSSKDKYSIS